jgi:Leucine-rich repeat (LRR) protein
LTLLKSLKFIELHGNPIREVQISLSIAIESSSLDGTIDSFYLQFPNVSCPSFSSLCDKFGKAEYTFREIITSVCSIARKTSMHLTLPSLGIAVTPHAKLFHKQQTRIDISNNLVCDLNASLFSTDCCLTDINFSHNKLSNTLVFDNFSSLVKLQCLNLSNNQFTKYILHHSSVVRIDLSHNSIEVVPIEAFDSWTSLIYADFSHNPLHQFGDVSNKVDINTWYDMVFQDQEVFAHKQLPLESLILENTGIFGCIPTVFARLRALQKLDISGTYISDLPPAFWRVFEDLTPETANFNRCPLSHLSVQIFESFFLDKFSEASELDARRAILQNGLPRGFQASQILDCCAAAEKSLHLECSHMDLTNLPKPCLIMNLTTMDISWNHLLNLPPEIFCMTNLKSLNISKNDIAVLSENISKLSNLHFLDIHDTNITELPYSLALLPSLHTVIWHPAELTRFEIQHKTTLDQDQLPPRIPPASVFFGGWTHSKLFMMQIIDSQKNQTLELCGISLQVLPRELARFELSGSIIELTLNHCLLQELPGWFSRFSVLTHLDVSNNKLSRLPDNFSVLTSICHLDLSSNPIAEAFPAASALTNIVFLNLGTTQIDLLHPSISHLIRLRTLSLQHTKLSVIPSFISVLNCLQALLLDGCPLSSISWAIGRCSSLRELQCKSCSSVIETPHRYYVNLGSSELLAYMKLLCQAQESGAISIMHTNLESFPEEIAEIVQLKSLTLLGINIKRVLQSIGHLKNLEELSVAQNVLPFLPNEIGQLKQLQELDVSSNLLTSLPDSLGNCKFLTSMQLSHNKFQEWPPCMFELVSIQMLSFSNNQLELVPEGISKLTTLQQLFLQKNSLLTVSWAVQGLQNLETIDLSHNYLSTISVYFGACPRLRRFRRVDLPLLEMKFSRMHALSDRDFIIQLREMYAEYAVQNSTKLKW